jgi:hypothetical protein
LHRPTDGSSDPGNESAGPTDGTGRAYDDDTGMVPKVDAATALDRDTGVIPAVGSSRSPSPDDTGVIPAVTSAGADDTGTFPGVPLAEGRRPEDPDNRPPS